jgi:hypothetical protein
MEFSEFVTTYYSKTRKSGKPWEPATVAEDSGLPLDQVQAWWGWCREEGGTDAELITKWETEGLVPIQTPFGTLWNRKSIGDPDRLISSLTVRELEAMFVRHLKG